MALGDLDQMIVVFYMWLPVVKTNSSKPIRVSPRCRFFFKGDGMALRLIQVRVCDGVCCEENPRFPTPDHSDCIYHNPGLLGKGNTGCQLMLNPMMRPDESKKMVDRMFDGMSAMELFESTCAKWPQNTPPKDQIIGNTGGCCFQWVEDGK
ncbi:hypothetical protein LCGC14_3045280 [marine sediment metagenome]|uniref:Uncharacterized protein n=1 Tax=marine sediment metagenome TaxID=412755 RepID=A0A0F8XBQ2_9ZZZZ